MQRIRPNRGRLTRSGQENRRRLFSTFGDLLIVGLGAGCSFAIHYVGELPVAEILVLAVFIPVIIAYYKRAFRHDLIPVYVLLGLWLMNQIVTDIYRGSAAIDWMRGDAAILFFFMDLALIAVLLTRNDRRKVLFLVSYSVASLMMAWYHLRHGLLESPWKFGFSTGTNMLIVLLASYFASHRRYMLALMCIVGIIGVNLLENFRSPILILLVTIALSLPVIPEQIGRWRVLPPQGTKMRLVTLTGIALLAGLTASFLVRFATSHGLVSEEDQQKNQQQAQFKGGLLLGGRPEILVSSRAVANSPILGYGSFAKNFKYSEMMTDLMTEYGVGVNVAYSDETDYGTIPTHSHVMSAWVWAGILGAVFWIYVMWLTSQAIFRLASTQPTLGPIYTFLLVNFAWAILFSPFGSTVRITDAVLIIIAIDLLQPEREQILQISRGAWRRRALQPIVAPGASIG